MPPVRIDGDDVGVRLLYLAREIPHSSHATTGAERRVAAFVDELSVRRVSTVAYLAPVAARPGAGGPARSGSAWRRLPLPVRGLRRDLARIVGAVWFVARHLGSIRRFDPSVVLERATYLDPAGALIARVLGVPHVLELHGDLAADARGYYASPLARLGAAYESRRYRQAERTVVVSRGLADRLETDGVPASRIVIVPNGVSSPAMRPARELARKRWEVGDRDVVGWIGHLMPWQIDAFEELVTGLNDVDARRPLALVLVAPLTEATAGAIERIRTMARFPVVLPGEATGAAADEAVAGFDVGVIPAARAYDLPVKLFHYAMLGVAVVAPDTRSIRELDADRELLYLFESGGAAHAVEHALADAGRLDRAARLRRMVEERHTWPVVVGDVLSVCRAVVSAGAVPRRSHRSGG